MNMLHVSDRMKEAMVAKVAFQCSELYADALKLMQLHSIKELWPKVNSLHQAQTVIQSVLHVVSVVWFPDTSGQTVIQSVLCVVSVVWFPDTSGQTVIQSVLCVVSVVWFPDTSGQTVIQSVLCVVSVVWFPDASGQTVIQSYVWSVWFDSQTPVDKP